MQLWPHQSLVLSETARLTSQGVRRVLVTAPTGSGKSLIMVEEAERAINSGQRVGLMTPRKLLTDQIIGYFEDRQIPFSVRAAGYEDYFDDSRPVQICSALTEHSRVNKRMTRNMPGVDLMLIDEAHMQATGVNRDIIEQNFNAGATIIGYTATPVNLKGMYDELIVGGKNSDLRNLGILLPAKLHDAGTPDLSKIKRHATGEFVNADLSRSGYVQTIVGKVIDHYKNLNPHGLPTILFAPGLPESKWFVDQFDNAGIHAAHIDGDDVYIDGKEHKRSPELKQQLFDDVASGKVKVLCNRFVCREGVDIPELHYGILACPIGSLTSYIQAVGRLLRVHPSMQYVRIADHGGNFHRHGSPNADRDWHELWGFTSSQIESARKMDINSGKTESGFSCPNPNCSLVWGRIPDSGKCECGADMSRTFECYNCGAKHRSWPIDCKCQKCGESLRGVRKRRVLQTDGELIEVPDEAYRATRVKKAVGSEELWASWYWRFRKHRPEKTLNQAWGGFRKEHWEKFRCFPPRDLKLMPVQSIDWHMKVGDLKINQLR